MKKILLLFTILVLVMSVQAQVKEMEVGNVLFTQDKGIALKFTATEKLLHGELVQTDTNTGYVRKNSDTGSTKTVGVVYVRGKKTDTITAGNPVWIVIKGIAEVRIEALDSLAKNDTSGWVKASITTGGIAHLRAYSTTNNYNAQIGFAVIQLPFKRNGLWFTKALLKFP